MSYLHSTDFNRQIHQRTNTANAKPQQLHPPISLYKLYQTSPSQVPQLNPSTNPPDQMHNDNPPRKPACYSHPDSWKSPSPATCPLLHLPQNNAGEVASKQRMLSDRIYIFLSSNCILAKKHRLTLNPSKSGDRFRPNSLCRSKIS